MKGRSLLLSFTFFSFLAFFITGIILVWFINKHMKEEKIKSIEDIVQVTVQCALKPDLTIDDIENGIDEAKKSHLDSKLSSLINKNALMGIKIFNNNNEIIYSLNHENLKTYFTEKDKLQDEIDREQANKIISLQLDSETGIAPKEDKVLVVTLPVIIGNNTVGFYTVYKSYDLEQIHMRELTVNVSIIVFVGLLILYFLLIKIVNNSSKTLILQNDALLKNKIHIQEAYDKLNSSYKDTIAALSNAIDTRDTYTAGHSKRVSEIALKIGGKFGFEKEQLEVLELSALFHDIGKLGIKDSILLKTDKLTDDEFHIIKQHTALGANIISNIDFLKKTEDIILYHHEKFGGGGYPTGIKGEDIPIEARIITVADSYDAMTSDRPYRKGMSHSEAVKELLNNQGTQFDRNVVEAFLKVYG